MLHLFYFILHALYSFNIIFIPMESKGSKIRNFFCLKIKPDSHDHSTKPYVLNCILSLIVLTRLAMSIVTIVEASHHQYAFLTQTGCGLWYLIPKTVAIILCVSAIGIQRIALRIKSTFAFIIFYAFMIFDFEETVH